MALSDEELDRFVYHPPPSEERAHAHDLVRDIIRITAKELDAVVPPGRHRALMLTNLQETMFWANAAVAMDS